MHDMQETGGLLDGILAVTHPALYQMAHGFLPRLAARVPELQDPISQWPSVFNAAQIVVNRMSLYHQDISGLEGWLDLLLTIGTYSEAGVMVFRNLGVTIPYDTGSIVLLATRTVTHGVPAVPPDRISLAFFMTYAVYRWLGEHVPGWSMYEDAVVL